MFDDFTTFTLDFLALAFAVEQRARTLGLGVSSAVLSDGVFLRNGRLGCHFTPMPGDCGFSLHLASPGGAALLWRVPLVAISKEGWEGWWGWCPPGSTAKQFLGGIGGALFPGLRTTNIVGLHEVHDPVLARQLHRLAERRGVRVNLWPEGSSTRDPGLSLGSG